MKEYHYIHSDMNALFYIRAHWTVKRIWWPRQCELSNRWIWPGRKCFEGTATFVEKDQTRTETRWHAYQEHQSWLIKEL